MSARDPEEFRRILGIPLDGVELIEGEAMPNSFVVLDRVEPDLVPRYCIHGRATCVYCGEWVWLGHATHEVVATRRAAPICHQCAKAYLQRGKVVGNTRDHRRADGPHT